MGGYSKEELEKALETIASVIRKIEKANSHFRPGTPQHTLATHRLKAFKIASDFIEKSLKALL